jgi:hypothetical protein
VSTGAVAGGAGAVGMTETGAVAADISVGVTAGGAGCPASADGVGVPQCLQNRPPGLTSPPQLVQKATGAEYRDQMPVATVIPGQYGEAKAEEAQWGPQSPGVMH